MGLLKAGIGAVGGVLADQWKEYFYCEAMDRDILVMEGAGNGLGKDLPIKKEMTTLFPMAL